MINSIDESSTATSKTVKVAGIGLGSMGSVNMRTASRAGAQIVALCDVDEAQMARIHKHFPEASLEYGLSPVTGAGERD